MIPEISSSGQGCLLFPVPALVPDTLIGEFSQFSVPLPPIDYMSKSIDYLLSVYHASNEGNQELIRIALRAKMKLDIPVTFNREYTLAWILFGNYRNWIHMSQQLYKYRFTPALSWEPGSGKTHLIYNMLIHNIHLNPLPILVFLLMPSTRFYIGDTKNKEHIRWYQFPSMPNQEDIRLFIEAIAGFMLSNGDVSSTKPLLELVISFHISNISPSFDFKWLVADIPLRLSYLLELKQMRLNGSFNDPSASAMVQRLQKKRNKTSGGTIGILVDSSRASTELLPAGTASTPFDSTFWDDMATVFRQKLERIEIKKRFAIFADICSSCISSYLRSAQFDRVSVGEVVQQILDDPLDTFFSKSVVIHTRADGMAGVKSATPCSRSTAVARSAVAPTHPDCSEIEFQDFTIPQYFQIACRALDTVIPFILISSADIMSQDIVFGPLEPVISSRTFQHICEFIEQHGSQPFRTQLAGLIGLCGANARHCVVPVINRFLKFQTDGYSIFSIKDIIIENAKFTALQGSDDTSLVALLPHLMAGAPLPWCPDGFRSIMKDCPQFYTSRINTDAKTAESFLPIITAHSILSKEIASDDPFMKLLRLISSYVEKFQTNLSISRTVNELHEVAPLFRVMAYFSYNPVMPNILPERMLPVWKRAQTNCPSVTLINEQHPSNYLVSKKILTSTEAKAVAGRLNGIHVIQCTKQITDWATYIEALQDDGTLPEHTRLLVLLAVSGQPGFDSAVFLMPDGPSHQWYGELLESKSGNTTLTTIVAKLGLAADIAGNASSSLQHIGFTALVNGDSALYDTEAIPICPIPRIGDVATIPARYSRPHNDVFHSMRIVLGPYYLPPAFAFFETLSSYDIESKNCKHPSHQDTSSSCDRQSDINALWMNSKCGAKYTLRQTEHLRRLSRCVASEVSTEIAAIVKVSGRSQKALMRKIATWKRRKPR
eukprot:gnl/Dysnectes_brevis/4138_a5452_608.p1 GENE.gnl/Dysnectes_brevis/4138_a5452_608~~gnl/Dysnectes_brevis/4138_a5452_608.p1  ORF type:complete len:963 (+),score=60.03 gnl/Dysnectes_brevis/4138_a5452_608:55-2889(+)